MIAIPLWYHRKKRRVAQQKLVARLQAMHVSINQRIISKIESSRRIVTDYELVRICRAPRMPAEHMPADFREQYPE